MRAFYVSCFHDNDPAEGSLNRALAGWPGVGRVLVQERATDGEDLRTKLMTGLTPRDRIDALIVGGHGHASLSGLWVRDDPVRWHDLAFLLREQVRYTCTFIFYSCNGGYPGIMHALGRADGIDFAFGPRVSAYAGALAHATMSVLTWKEAGGVDAAGARALVDQENAWGAATYPAPANEPHDRFFRVMWGEGPNARHPDEPNGQVPYGPLIPLRGWGLD